MNTPQNFVWETHGIHIGTGKDHVKHGVDSIDEIIQLAIAQNHPDIAFIIHTPRLTKFRYDSERATDIKFIRGDRAYADYPGYISGLKKKYGHRINIRYGVELEWLGSGIGLEWNRAKILQAGNTDFVIGSVHFSREGIPYDGSREEAERLLKMRGSLEKYWDSYLLEVMEMIDSSHEFIQVVGHLDLPKLHVGIPEPLREMNSSTHYLARRMRTLMELISEYNLAIDVNLAGINKGCGIYPNQEIMKRAAMLNIPVTLGTDTHAIDDYGANYRVGLQYLSDAGFKHYVYFSRYLPSKHPVYGDPVEISKYQTLNLGIELLNQRFDLSDRNLIPNISFGGTFQTLLENFPKATALGNYEAIRVRKGPKSLTIGAKPDTSSWGNGNNRVLFSHHLDKPGTLSMLFNSLASEEINVDTAFLDSNSDGTAVAYLSLNGDEGLIANAIEFIVGTVSDRFLTVEYSDRHWVPENKSGHGYILEVDGVDLPIKLSEKMILSVHQDSPGVLLILLSALASAGINIKGLQLGKRGNKGYAVMSIEGDSFNGEEIKRKLGPLYYEVSYLNLSQLNNSIME